jgi:phosphoribosylamine--glycine ligase
VNLLVVGNGGREHALVWKLSQSADIDKIYVAPGNGGTAIENKCQNIDIKAEDIDGLLKFAKHNSINFTVVGPEVPLAKGIVDLFLENNMKIFGPVKAAAQIEASKIFAKEVMAAAGVPTAKYKRFNDAYTAKTWLASQRMPIVVKADGLAAGKGVIIAHTLQEANKAIDKILVNKAFGEAGYSVVIEEFLDGEEVSYLVITDGETIIPLVSAQDHKAVFDNDKGPNTGGMGAYSPAPVLNYDKLSELVAKPIIAENRLQRGSLRGFDGIYRQFGWFAEC